MLFTSWLRNVNPSAWAACRRTEALSRPRTRLQPKMEAIEDRCLLSGYLQSNLVGYKPGFATLTDTNLNGWGMTSMPDGSFVVANTFTTGLATFYSSSGQVLPQTITIPGSASPAIDQALGLGPGGHPTGVVYNPTNKFRISEHGKSAPARLIFDSIDGTISGWNPKVDPTHAIVMVDNGAAGDAYTGLDMAQNSKGHYVLYAADFTQNRVEKFNGKFQASGSFTDSTVTSIEPSFSTWSVQAVGNKLYVTFASLANTHGGVVDVFNTDGTLLTPQHFAANAFDSGPLENPWGIVQAPSNFGAYSNDILIGNVAGFGNINVFDPSTGAYIGQLDGPDGTAIANTGLWDLEFGDGTPQGGKTDQLFFDAGPNSPGVAINGLFGVIEPADDQASADRRAGATAAQVAHPRHAQASIEALLASTRGREAGNQVGDSGDSLRGSRGYSRR